MVVIVHPMPALAPLLEQTIVYFSALKDVDALTMKEVVAPTPKIHITLGVKKDSLAVTEATLSDLTDVSAISHVQLHVVYQSPDPPQEFVLLVEVVGEEVGRLEVFGDEVALGFCHRCQ